MAFYHRNNERKQRHDYRREEEEVVGSLCRLGNRPISPKSLLEQEKRIRREIANSNERRRMQSINAGFQSLRALLPHREGEKLSKAAILQSTADYVFQLEQEKARLLEQNSQFSRRLLHSPSNIQDSDGSCSGSPLPKRKKREPADCIDEGIGSSSPSRSENGGDDMKREIMELRLQLEHERTLRVLVEQQLRNLESRLYSTDNEAAEQYHSVTEDIDKCLNFGQESGLGSPISSQDVESSHEMSPRGSSPELSNLDVPEDLSGKSSSVLLPSVDELSISDNTIPGLVLSSSDISIESFPVDFNIASQQTSYKVSTSRQNLETIVEAIRHVEGDHMFRDDPTPELLDLVNESQIMLNHKPDQTSMISFQHHIIKKAPLIQSRPGVIVSNLS
ncbi:transcription factor AP-4 isoform X2 [Parasteatoda tepidariorum]|uniref:transcription factor AP-4 isoform X2 n=1 Tax=Parasteatoda tepidariorum TaxID=114398 RepID=UPI00077FC7BF|nr:transcription factor AP-4 isoform X1 [Parasteatoda tepidariorum]